MTNLYITKHSSTAIKFSQTIYSEEDKSKPCINYPTKKFASYGECDESFVYQNMLEKFNIVTFWSARSIDQVSTTRYMEYG